MHLTLSVDKQVLDKARAIARVRGTRLNEMIRRYLEQFPDETDPAGTFHELRELFLTRGGHSAGHPWRREDLQRG